MASAYWTPPPLPARINTVVHTDNENASDGTRLDRGRDFVKLWLSHSKRCFSWTHFWIWAPLLRANRKRDEHTAFTAKRIIGVALRSDGDSRLSAGAKQKERFMRVIIALKMNGCTKNEQKATGPVVLRPVRRITVWFPSSIRSRHSNTLASRPGIISQT